MVVVDFRSMRCPSVVAQSPLNVRVTAAANIHCGWSCPISATEGAGTPIMQRINRRLAKDAKKVVQPKRVGIFQTPMALGQFQLALLVRRARVSNFSHESTDFDQNCRPSSRTF